MLHPPKEIYATESFLPEVIETSTISHYACLSPKYSAREQITNVRNLLLKWDFLPESTIIVVVDFGGDILTNGTQSSIISPELDAFTLALVRNLSEYTSTLAVCFPGVDGELDADYLDFMCSSKSIAKDPIDVETWKSQLITLFEKLKSKRPGNTIPNMIKILDDLTNGDETTCCISKHFMIGRDRYEFQNELTLNRSLQSYVHYFDLDIDNPYTNVFNSDNYNLKMLLDYILEIYEKQIINDSTNQLTDLHLQYLRTDLDNKYTNRCLLVNDNDDLQRVMLVNLVPHRLRNNDACSESIKKLNIYDEFLNTYDELYRE
jgi:hypothetical protein